MGNLNPLRNGVICLILLAVAPFLFAEQNPVDVESRDTNLQDLPFEAPIEDTVEVSAGEAVYQMQLLQQEVQELRGLVEELGYRLNRMQITQEDRYLELDSRFQSLGTQLSTNPTTSSSPISSNIGTTTDGEALAGQDSLNASTLYETAIDLINRRQYDLAITQLQTLIAQFPESKFAPNAYYWLGEVYAAKPDPDYENSRKALAQVITFFPEHRKVPAAAFKLGKVHHLMGDCMRATDLLNQVMEQQQGKSVAKLAESYLRDKVGTCE